MRWTHPPAASLLVSALFLSIGYASLAHSATPGSFRGTVVEGEQGGPQQGWLYVRGRNRTLRRVDISHASVEYDEDVPLGQRKTSAREQLIVGAEVRVTAQQGNDGEWRASRVEIITLASAPGGDAATT